MITYTPPSVSTPMGFARHITTDLTWITSGAVRERVSLESLYDVAGNIVAGDYGILDAEEWSLNNDSITRNDGLVVGSYLIDGIGVIAKYHLPEEEGVPIVMLDSEYHPTIRVDPETVPPHPISALEAA